MASPICIAAGRISAMAALLVLASCASQPQRVMREPPPPQTPAAPVYDRLPVAAINQDISSEEAIWHLRAGMNVAALNCGTAGHAAVDSGYNRMLEQHRQMLAAAYDAETLRFGKDRAGVREMDRHQTGLYNFFANIRSLTQFCRTAHGLARRINGMPSTELALASRHLLAELEEPLRR